MTNDALKRQRSAAFAELTAYAISRGWTIWTDGVTVVLVDPERGREAAVAIQGQLLEQGGKGCIGIVPPHILVKRLNRDRGWRRVKTIRRPGALSEREGKTQCSFWL